MINSNRNLRLVILTAICLGFIFIRFWRLTDSCLWFDEIFSVHATTLDWVSMLRFVARDLIHPPLFYVALKLWIAVGGENLLWLRSFSVLFAMISIVPFYLLCRKLKFGGAALLIALTFFAASGALVKYAQEVRMYSLLLCLSLFSMWLFLRFLNLGKSFWLLTLINILLVYTQYFGWMIVLSEVLAILILQRIKIGKILLMFGLTILSFAPWIFAVLKNANLTDDASQNLGWANKPNPQILAQFALDLFEPFYYRQSSVDAASIYFVTIPLLLIVLAAAVFYFVNQRTENEEEKRNIKLLLIFIFFPLFFAFAASWILPFSIWGTRHLTIVFAPAMILAALFISRLKPAPLKIGVLYVIFILFGIALFVQMQRGAPRFIWCAWENLAAKLPAREPVKIYAYEDLVAYHLWYAARASDRKVEIIKVNDVTGLTEDKAYFLPRGFDAVRKASEKDISGGKFWLAFRDLDFDLTKPPLKSLIEKGYKIGQPAIYEAQGQKAFLVAVEKAK